MWSGSRTRSPVDRRISRTFGFCASLARILGLESSHLRDLLTPVRPCDSRGFGARIAGPFGVEHHLPESLHTGITLAAKRERRGGEIGQDSELVPLGKNHLAGLGCLGEHFPSRLVGLRNGRPPMRGIPSAWLGCGNRDRGGNSPQPGFSDCVRYLPHVRAPALLSDW